MTIDSLEKHMRDGAFVRQQQEKYLKYYAEADRKHRIVGSYQGQPYITLSNKEVLDQGLSVMICNQTEMCLYHVHDWIELSYVYRGSCHMKIMDNELDLMEGQFILLNTGVPHAEGKIGPDGIFLNFIFDKRYFDNHFFSELTADSIVTRFFVDALNDEKDKANYILFRSEADERIPFLVRILLCEYFDPSVCGIDIIRSSVTMLLCELIRTYQRDETPERTQSLQIARILRFIENNCTECTLQQTAKFFCISPNYLTAQLKKTVGMSFKQLVQDSRLKKAARLLRESDASVREIANHVGYENIGFFNSKFAQSYGVLPGEYRNLRKKQS